MLELRVSHSEPLERHLSSYEFDGSTVEAALFSDGRLMYPGRHDVEQTMRAAEPYTLSHEARVIEGFYGSIVRSIWVLSEAAADLPDLDPTLELLWQTHSAARRLNQPPSLDRLVAALVMVERIRGGGRAADPLGDAAYVLVRAMAAAGFPVSASALEEIWDGAAPACVGLDLVEIG